MYRGITRVCCDECSRGFSSCNLLEIHHDKHHYIRQCPNCDKTFQRTKKYLKHLRSHLNHCPYQCKICLESFNEEGDLRNHKKTHNNPAKRTCRECGLKCDDLPILLRHLMTHGKKPYQCYRCASCFSNLTDRNTHLKNHILRCEICKIPMKETEHLIKHVNENHRSHKREYAPVLGDPCLEYPDFVITGKCEDSDSMEESSSSDDESDDSDRMEESSSDDESKSFLIREANTDIKSVYNAKHEDYFICFICLQLCPTSKLLEYHLKAHNWCPCPYCPKFFIGLQDLEMHKRENHYHPCTLCEARFEYEKDLNLHMPNCRLYSNIKSKLTGVVQVVLENKESDIQEELCRKLKEVEIGLGGDCKLNFAIKKSLNCMENVCEDRVAESFIHYHFPRDLVFDVNFSNSGRNDEDLFKLSDTLLQSRMKIMQNLSSYADKCERFLTEISFFRITAFVEEIKMLQFPLELHQVEQLIFYKVIIENACKSPLSKEMPDEVKDYLQCVHYYLSRISRRHIISE